MKSTAKRIINCKIYGNACNVYGMCADVDIGTKLGSATGGRTKLI